MKGKRKTAHDHALIMKASERAGDPFADAVAQKGSAWHFLDCCLSLLTVAEEIEKEGLE